MLNYMPQIMKVQLWSFKVYWQYGLGLIIFHLRFISKRGNKYWTSKVLYYVSSPKTRPQNVVQAAWFELSSQSHLTWSPQFHTQVITRVNCINTVLKAWIVSENLCTRKLMQLLMPLHNSQSTKLSYRAIMLRLTLYLPWVLCVVTWLQLYGHVTLVEWSCDLIVWL
jgi:hypothetical protein